MAEYCLVSDVTAEISPLNVEKYGIRIVPMTFYLGEKEYHQYPDNHELSMKEFYEGQVAGLETKSSQITPAEFTKEFEKILKEGKDIIYYGLSSGLSGTYNSSVIAADELMDKYPDRRIKCINAICASVGEGYIFVMAAKKAAEENMDFDEVVKYIEETQYRICHWFMVDNLDQLRKGGRISAVSAIVGSALNICPIITTNREGELRVAAKVRGKKKAMSYLIDKIEEDGIRAENDLVMVGHANNMEAAEKLKSEILERGLANNVEIADIGPVIGSHVGSGMCAVLFVGENFKDI
ncbi:MAG: DegV family protein [Lachnospiraceae bacterium]|nr:DegV family protein [Lachnospiraceae bacterium]